MAPLVAPALLGEAAAFVIRRVTHGTLVMMVLIAPTAREFVAASTRQHVAHDRRRTRAQRGARQHNG